MYEPVTQNVFKQTRIILSLVLLLIVFGIAGFMIFERWSFLESLYMTIITITTVGFKEVKPLSDAGRSFTVVLIVCGVGTWAFAFGAAIRLLAEGQLNLFFSQRRVEKMIGSLKGHFIVCGFGRIGTLVCRQLTEEKISFVVVEKSTIHVDELKKLGYLYVSGDATEEETLMSAGIQNARCLVSALATDAGNVYTVLTARHLNPSLFIVCRSGEESAEDKILKAGANRVISPYRIGGMCLANAALRPNILDFINLVSTKGQLDLSLEEFPIPKGSSLAGLSLMDSKIRERFGIIVVACRTEHDEMIYNPSAQYVIKEEDVFIALGKSEGFDALRSEVGRGSSLPS